MEEPRMGLTVQENCNDLQQCKLPHSVLASFLLSNLLDDRSNVSNPLRTCDSRCPQESKANTREEEGKERLK